jgi:hypothetical protein|tara:strand:- start:217 stop:414 length:198 start_codon:yes stop_codon:yes gene_type:complete
MGLTVLDVLKKNIEEQKLTSIQFLTSGGPKDYAQYKEVTGLIRGLGVSIGIIEDLVRQQENGEDE